MGGTPDGFAVGGLDCGGLADKYSFCRLPNSNKEFYDTFSVAAGLTDLKVKYGNRLQAMPCYFTV